MVNQIIVPLLFAAAVLAVPGGSATAEMPQNGIYAAYVLLGQSEAGEMVPMARVIVDRKLDCPALIAQDTTQPYEISLTPRANPNDMNFPINVCEALYPFDQAMGVEGTPIVLPPVKARPVNFLVFGDTGCIPEKYKKQKQPIELIPCPPAYWPFAALAEAAANAEPAADLIIHVGDYNYRGTPGTIDISVNGQTMKQSVYDAGDNAPRGTCQLPGPYYGQNSKGSQSPDQWENWWLDFFQPAQRLLPTAPWVFIRGNHELCSRAGPGWFYFLDSNSSLLGPRGQQLSCPSVDRADRLVFGAPYVLKMADLNLVILDSANACDSGELHTSTYETQFQLIQHFLKGTASRPAWLLSHRPLWGAVKLDDGGSCSGDARAPLYGCINQTLQAAQATFPLPEEIGLIVSGHMHRFQSLNFARPRAQQLIIGDGGVELASTYPPSPFSGPVDGQTASGFGLSQFGYMTLSLTEHGRWTGKLVNPTASPSVLATCNSNNPAESGLCVSPP